MNLESKNCLSCGGELKGKYCFGCGEKVVQDSDFSITRIIGEGFSAFTNLDNKLFRSFGALVFKPGLLSQEYILGRRNKYMKPFQLFLLCSVLLFIFLSDFDVVLIPSRWFFFEKYEFGLQVMDLVRAKMASLELTLEEIRILYDTKVVNYSKIGLIILVPVMAVFSYLFGRKSMPEFGKHFIFNIHNFCFLLILISFFITFFRWTPWQVGKFPVYLVFVIILTYLILSNKRMLNLSWLKAIAIGVANFGFLFIAMFLYRMLISFFTLWVL